MEVSIVGFYGWLLVRVEEMGYGWIEGFNKNVDVQSIDWFSWVENVTKRGFRQDP